MKKRTIITMAGILALSLSYFTSQSATNEVTSETFNRELLIQEKDPNLTIENWMINDHLWHESTMTDIEEVSDKELSLESWMIQNHIW